MRSALEFLPINQISTNPARPRQTISQESLSQLSDSIRKYGILSPLLVNKKGNTYHIICGERRWRAAKVAGLDEVPCLIVTVEAHELSLLSLAENLQREALNLVDQAFLITKLHEKLGFSLIEIGESTGMKLADIEKRLLVLLLPERIRRSYLSSELSAAELMKLVDIEDPIQQEATYKKFLVQQKNK